MSRKQQKSKYKRITAVKKQMHTIEFVDRINTLDIPNDKNSLRKFEKLVNKGLGKLRPETPEERKHFDKLERKARKEGRLIKTVIEVN